MIFLPMLIKKRAGKETEKRSADGYKRMQICEREEQEGMVTVWE